MRRTSLALALACAITAAAGGSQAQDAGHGADFFGQYCATCHGTGGTGDGPLADMMTTKVPDLTMLASRNDGAFPMLTVIHVIDGRTGLRAHGGPMPVWGAIFEAEGDTDSKYGDVLYGRGKVLSIAYYLESIQK